MAGDESAVVLINPKTPYNVGGALRACSIFGVPDLRWTGDRVADPRKVGQLSKRCSNRLPREERMKDYRNTSYWPEEDAVRRFIAEGYTPVCVEVDESAESLPFFVHPARPVYIFGPEDGDVPKGIRTVCHRFVTIPSSSCLNVAAAVNVVLYDRRLKEMVRPTETDRLVAVLVDKAMNDR